MNKQGPGKSYSLVQVDLQDIDPNFESFPEEKSVIVRQSDDLADLLVFAIYEFKKNNNITKVKLSYNEWLKHATEGGYEYLILNPGHQEIFRVSTVFNPTTEYALYLAVNHHKEQILRINGRPFLEHALEVAHILRKAHLDFSLKDEIIAASLCHALLKQTTCTPNEIEQACGPDALNLVETVTDDADVLTGEAWEERKRAHLETLKASDVEAIVITVADHISLINALLDQYMKDGPEIWKRFHNGKDKELWFKKEVLKIARRRWRHPLVFDYERLLKKIEQIPENPAGSAS